MKFKSVLIKCFLFLLISITAFSCSEDNDNDTLSSCESSIPFLKEGTVWTHNIKTFGFDNGQLTLTVKSCNGEDYAVDMLAENSSYDELLTNSDVIWEETDDFILAYVASNIGSKIFKKDAKLGDVWMHTQADGGIATHEVIKIDSVVTVPAGTFTCKVYKYTATDIINESFVFWNDDIGQIKEDSPFLSTELVSYTIN